MDNLEVKINQLIEKIAKYDTESFVGFFAYFLKRRPDDSLDIKLNLFKSKFKDFQYLMAIKMSLPDENTKKFELDDSKIIGELAKSLNEIKDFYQTKNFSDYTVESVIHELAYRNHFDNGSLSYVEQDLEKIRTIFSHFEEKIITDFGFDIDFLIQFYQYNELISKNRAEKFTAFSTTTDFINFTEKIKTKETSFSESLELLSKETKEDFLSFFSKPHEYLFFSKEDLFQYLPKNEINRFLELFCLDYNSKLNHRYYAAENPIENKPILKLSKNYYLNLCQKQIPIAIYNHLYLHFLNDKKNNPKIRRHREKCLEKKVVEIFKSFFSHKESYFFENYYVEENFEQDLLIIYKGNAIIIETKASKLRAPFRDTDKAITRLKDDFKNSIQYGYQQCLRIEDYFFDNKIFEIKNRQNKTLHKIDPNKIHNILSIVVTLERYGSLQTDLALLLDKHEEDYYPWSVYIDDLETFLLSLKHYFNNHGNRLIEYLKLRRTLHGRIYAIDELDICASFIKEPRKFRASSKNKLKQIKFSAFEQSLFDKLYFSGKLNFKENPLPNKYC
ncbi:hypothetical protein [Wenyingzhuangia sp. IMCC45574]